MYKCRNCSLATEKCKACILKTHKEELLHFVDEWDGERGFWRQKSLADLGAVIELGHGGERCMKAGATTRSMVIGSPEGVNTIAVRFCCCLDPTTGVYTPDATQLLHAKLWPHTWDEPTTAFTFSLMKDFELFSNQAVVNAYDFWKIMQRKTDGIEPSRVSVSTQRLVCFYSMVNAFLGSATRTPVGRPNVGVRHCGKAAQGRF